MNLRGEGYASERKVTQCFRTAAQGVGDRRVGDCPHFTQLSRCRLQAADGFGRFRGQRSHGPYGPCRDDEPGRVVSKTILTDNSPLRRLKSVASGRADWFATACTHVKRRKL